MDFEQLHLHCIHCVAYAYADPSSDTDSNPNRHASADSDGHPYTNAGSNFDSHRHTDACSDSHVDTHPDGRHADVLAKRRNFPSTGNRGYLVHDAGRDDLLHDRRDHAHNQLACLQRIRSDTKRKRHENA